jgi:hypothetical protein
MRCVTEQHTIESRHLAECGTAPAERGHFSTRTGDALGTSTAEPLTSLGGQASIPSTPVRDYNVFGALGPADELWQSAV